MSDRSAPTPGDFVAETVLKRDAFSETALGHLAGAEDRKVALRRIDSLPLWSRPVARWLARREARALARLHGIAGMPELLRADRTGILRVWTEGTPLQLARPATPDFYRDARRLLREMRHRGVTHNDVAKPQNWLVTPEGRAAVIDFQLASVHRRRGRLFRTMAREDLRHLLKQKRAYAPDLLTAGERRMLARKALPARLWMATAKPAYNFVTRRLMNWSDGEGTGDRLEREGGALNAALDAARGVRGHVVTSYPLPAHGVGLYVFAETDRPAAEVARALPAPGAEKVQAIAALPRAADGTPRRDLLALIAANRVDELEAALQRDPGLRPVLAPIIAGRLNLTDRIQRPAPPPADATS